jgi:5-methyltetrahydrofolate--homocysteine methyltransferase
MGYHSQTVSRLLYRPDSDAACDLLTTWWNGGDIGRPAMQITARRAEPIEDIPALPKPEGWSTNCSTRSFKYRVNLAARWCTHTHYLGEALPTVSPDLGANCLALYLGCTGADGEDTVWFEPCITDPTTARYELDPDNFYWDFTLRLAQEQLRLGAGKFLTSFPDLIEGLDTLAAMRATQPLLTDLIERPNWVQESLRQITDRYFKVYDILYEMIRDERGGSYFWAWAPGRLAKLQCDFSAMISPGMFAEFMAPVLCAMTERLDYCIYHWDGPGAIRHHDQLLAIPGITMIQWTPGAGAEPMTHPRWWPLYHKTVEAGKKVMLTEFDPASLPVFKREFGSKFKQFMISLEVTTTEKATDLLRSAED